MGQFNSAEYLKKVIQGKLDRHEIQKTTFAKAAKMSRSNLNRLLSGKSLNLDSLDRIAEALGSSPSELINEAAPAAVPAIEAALLSAVELELIQTLRALNQDQVTSEFLANAKARLGSASIASDILKGAEKPKGHRMPKA